MEGVRILASEEVAVTFELFNWTNAMIAGFIAFVLALFVGIVIGGVAGDFKTGVVAGVVIGLVGALLFGAACGFGTGKPTAYETQYKVILDDNVSMNEFYKYYEIIDQEGEIFTVRERK